MELLHKQNFFACGYFYRFIFISSDDHNKIVVFSFNNHFVLHVYTEIIVTLVQTTCNKKSESDNNHATRLPNFIFLQFTYT